VFWDYLLFCCVLPLGALAVPVLWSRVSWFGPVVGSLVLVSLACALPIATALAWRDVARTDRLLSWAQASECGSPGTTLVAGRRLRAVVAQTSAEMTRGFARENGLPAQGDAWRAVLRTIGTGVLATYAIGTPGGTTTFSGSDGEIGEEQVVFVALRRDLDDVLLGAPVALRSGAVVAHETLDVSWFWIVSDMLVIHDDHAGGTLELRDLDLRLRTRATGTGELREPIFSGLSDGAGGLYFAVDGQPVTIGHLTADGQWTRTQTTLDVRGVGGLSEARSGGLCVWSNMPGRGVAHLEGDPLASRAWPLWLALQDRLVELIALAIAWLALLLAARHMRSLAQPWLALRRGRVRVGEVRDARTEHAIWLEPDHADRGLRASEWLGFTGVLAEPEPAVLIDVAATPSDPSYRTSARDELGARWVVLGNLAQARASLFARLRVGASAVGFVVLLTGIPAVAVAIAIATGS
jgi:hypothetical protein